MLNTELILMNAIRTPDGTVIQSRGVHDYVQHRDANGEVYMVDGGTAYLRRNKNTEPYEELSQYYKEDDHLHNRQYAYWGTRGPAGDQPLTWKAIRDLDTEHIEAILTTETHIRGSHIEKILKTELHIREDREVEYEVTIYEGKYTYRRFRNGGQEALRYGEPWRNLSGDGFIMAMAQRIETLTDLLTQAGIYFDE